MRWAAARALRRGRRPLRLTCRERVRQRGAHASCLRNSRAAGCGARRGPGRPAVDCPGRCRRRARDGLRPWVDRARSAPDRHRGRYQHSAEWVAAQLRDAGVTRVVFEPFTIPDSWERDGASARIVAPEPLTLRVAALGWTPSTRGPIEAELVALNRCHTPSHRRCARAGRRPRRAAARAGGRRRPARGMEPAPRNRPRAGSGRRRRHPLARYRSRRRPRCPRSNARRRRRRAAGGADRARRRREDPRADRSRPGADCARASQSRHRGPGLGQQCRRRGSVDANEPTSG